MKMTIEAVFARILQRDGLQCAFWIVGSAFMLIADLFPSAGSISGIAYRTKV